MIAISLHTFFLGVLDVLKSIPLILEWEEISLTKGSTDPSEVRRFTYSMFDSWNQYDCIDQSSSHHDLDHSSPDFFLANIVPDLVGSLYRPFEEHVPHELRHCPFQVLDYDVTRLTM